MLFRLTLICLLLLFGSFFSLSQMTGRSTPEAAAFLKPHLIKASPQVVRGAEVYDLNCAVCHGDSGLGFAEAKLAFPETERKCTQCHKSGNPKLIDWKTIRDNDMFDVGTPPALRGSERNPQFANALVLYTYLKATMPRYEPGRLSNDEYLDVTAFLLSINGDLPRDINLDLGNAVKLELAN